MLHERERENGIEKNEERKAGDRTRDISFHLPTAVIITLALAFSLNRI